MADTTQTVEFAPYVLKAFPTGDKWHARALLGECVAAAGEGPTAEAAFADLMEQLPRRPVAPQRRAAFAGAGGFGFVLNIG